MAAEQLPGRPAETCRLSSPAVQEALGIDDQLLPGRHGIIAGWRDRAQAGQTIGPFGRDTGPGATLWSWLRWLRVRAAIPVLRLRNPRTRRLLKLLNLLKLRNSGALLLLNLC